ncbi:hypothetical protein EJ110_NYTH30021 [Nymphaea thermarum]|nr:hypothetical protein EJ110_NYTH30021 [Nymphaea thermarum]
MDRFGAERVNEWKEALRVAGNAPGFKLDDDRSEIKGRFAGQFWTCWVPNCSLPFPGLDPNGVLSSSRPEAASRIIFTTEDDSFLDAKMHKKYSPKELDDEEALQLFCYHAFGKMAPPEEYFRFSKQAVALCHGLPKALEKLGSFLSDKTSEDEWDDMLNKLKQSPPNAILDLV